MKVTSRELYGLRAMMELARRYHEGPVSLSKVARSRGLPLAYLEQIAAYLRKAGLVRSVRGAQGGYRLARPPAEISVGDVFRALEGNVVSLSCRFRDQCGILLDEGCYCEVDDDCSARDVWTQVHSALASLLDGITLADLITSEGGG